MGKEKFYKYLANLIMEPATLEIQAKESSLGTCVI